MKKVFMYVCLALLAVSLTFVFVACNNNADTEAKEAVETQSWQVASPDGSIKVEIGMDSDSNLYCSVAKGGVAVLAKSPLGLQVRDDDLGLLTFEKKAQRRVQGSYSNITGKHAQVDYDAMELQLTFESYKYVLDVFVRAYDDGYALRYKLDAIDGKFDQAKIESELTSFALPSSSLVWRQSYAPDGGIVVIDPLKNENIDTFSYENGSYNYVPASGIDSGSQIVFPVLYSPDGDVYSLLTESELVGSGFYGSMLQATRDDDQLKLQTVPMAGGSIEDDGYVSLPFTSPWRVGITGDLATVTESELVEKVYDDAEYWKPDNYDELSAEEQEIYDYEWVDPGVTCWSWIVYRAKDQKNYAIHTAYLDKCAEMGWKYLLLDGSWESDYNISDQLADSNSKGNLQQDGITTDGVPANWDAFVRYANQKGIKLIVWGDAIRSFANADYNVMCNTLDRWKAMGASGIKLDFWNGEREMDDGHQMPTHRGEDSKNMEWYETVYQECAKRQLIVNCHGCNKPTGERRVYPNVVNREAIYGAEKSAVSARDVVNELFTRNVIGPSDFTPLVKPMQHRFTTGFMIALPFLFEGMTTVGDTLTNLRYEPIQDLYKAIPTARDDTKFLCGALDEYYCQAVRCGDSWFVAGVNSGLDATSVCKVKFDFSFLGEGNWSGWLYKDGAMGADQKNEIDKTAVQYASSDSFNIDLGQNSGFVIYLTKN